MKKILLIIAVCVIFSYANAQTAEEINFEEQTVQRPEIKKIKYNVNMGTVVGFINNSTNFYNYIAPSLNYKFSPRISINAGFLITNTTSNGIYYYDNEKFRKRTGNITQSYFFTDVNYLASEKLILTGNVVYGTSFNQNVNNNGSGFKPISYSVGAEYKITEKIKIGIEIKHIERNSHFQNNFNRNSRFVNDFMFE